jgi:hypothetical protein
MQGELEPNRSEFGRLSRSFGQLFVVISVWVRLRDYRPSKVLLLRIVFLADLR